MATGQQWKHGWIPLTPAAMREKNHGSKPGPDSNISQMADKAIRAKAKNRSTRATTTTASKPSASDDVAAAAEAIRSGDRAKGVNLLTRAMNNTTDKKQRAAIKKQRDELARKLMGR